MKRLLISAAALLSALAIGLATSGQATLPTRVEIGGHQIRTLVSGHGSPTVILETFGPAYLETWNKIQPGIARFARVVAYDHAGYWGSEPGPKPRDGNQIAHELHEVLEKIGASPPYILVGYSFGGPYIRIFADRYPNEICGLVFVDPAQEEFMRWLNRRFPDMNVVTEADRMRQDEWGCQWQSLQLAQAAQLPKVPLTLITAARLTESPLLRRLMPEWQNAHSTWLQTYPGARHIITTNSGHGIFFTEPNLIVDAVRQMADSIPTKVK